MTSGQLFYWWFLRTFFISNWHFTRCICIGNWNDNFPDDLFSASFLSLCILFSDEKNICKKLSFLSRRTFARVHDKFYVKKYGPIDFKGFYFKKRGRTMSDLTVLTAFLVWFWHLSEIHAELYNKNGYLIKINPI